jgi:hypothetical protein
MTSFEGFAPKVQAGGGFRDWLARRACRRGHCADRPGPTEAVAPSWRASPCRCRDTTRSRVYDHVNVVMARAGIV